MKWLTCWITFVSLLLVAACADHVVTPQPVESVNALPFSATATTADDVCGEATTATLIAGQTMDAGTVRVWNTEDNLYVQYTTTGDWTLAKTHLAVGSEPGDIPTNRAENPVPGHFPHSAKHSGVTEHTYTLSLEDLGAEPGASVVIAAHAEVTDGERTEGAWGEGTRLVERGNWAMYFEHEVRECAPGDALPSTERFTVGPEGGRFELFDGGVVMDISAGALAEETEIGVTPVAEEPDLGEDWSVLPGTGYEFAPAGLQFEDPVESPVWLTIGFDPDDLPDPSQLYLGKVLDGEVFPLAESQVGQGSITAVVNGFSVIHAITWSCGCPPDVESIEINPEEGTLEVGGSGHLHATVWDIHGDVYNWRHPGGDVKWSSSDESVATVEAVTDRRALVRAMGVGTATMTASVLGVTSEATVTVTTRVARVEVTPESATIDRGQTRQFTATAYDQHDNVLSGPSFVATWSSTRPCIGAVGSDGLATGLNAGVATIVADIHGVTGSATLNVDHVSEDGSVPGSLQGDWTVCESSTGAYKLTLHLDHEAGSELVTGRVTMASGANSAISSGKWREGLDGRFFLDVSWTVHIQGGDRTFSIFDAVAQRDDLLVGDYNDRYIFHNYVVQIAKALDDD